MIAPRNACSFRFSQRAFYRWCPFEEGAMLMCRTIWNPPVFAARYREKGDIEDGRVVERKMRFCNCRRPLRRDPSDRLEQQSTTSPATAIETNCVHARNHAILGPTSCRA